MEQTITLEDGKSIVNRSITLRGPNIPILKNKHESIVLTDNGTYIDGRQYGTEIDGLMIAAYSENEANGPVRLRSLEVHNWDPSYEDDNNLPNYTCNIKIAPRDSISNDISIKSMGSKTTNSH